MPTATLLPGSGDIESLSQNLKVSANHESLPGVASTSDSMSIHPVQSVEWPSSSSSPLFALSDNFTSVMVVAMAVLILLVAIVIVATCLVLIRTWMKKSKLLGFPLEKDFGLRCVKRPDIVRVDNSGDVSISFSFTPPDNDQMMMKLLLRDPHNMSKNMSKVRLLSLPCVMNCMKYC